MSSELKKATTGLRFIKSIFLFALVGILIGVWLLLSCIWPSDKKETLDEQRARARAIRLDLLQKDNHIKLSAYAWANKDKGVVQLPISRAMELVAVELNAKPVTTSAVKVENPYPYGLQQVAAPAAPAAASGTNAPAAPGTAAPAPATSGSAAPQPAAITPAPVK